MPFSLSQLNIRVLEPSVRVLRRVTFSTIRVRIFLSRNVVGNNTLNRVAVCYGKSEEHDILNCKQVEATTLVIYCCYFTREHHVYLEKSIVIIKSSKIEQ